MALSGCEETVVERADGEVMESRAHRSHVEDFAHVTASATHVASSFAFPAVVVEGSDPDERRDLSAVEVPELRQEREERAARHGPHAFDGPQRFIPLFEFGQRLARGVDVVVERLNLFRKKRNGSFDASNQMLARSSTYVDLGERREGAHDARLSAVEQCYTLRTRERSSSVTGTELGTATVRSWRFVSSRRMWFSRWSSSPSCRPTSPVK
jgi:hypothetical protein